MVPAIAWTKRDNPNCGFTWIPWACSAWCYAAVSFMRKNVKCSVSCHLTALITDLTAGSKSSTEISQLQPFSSKPSSPAMLESVAWGEKIKNRRDYVDVLQVATVFIWIFASAEAVEGNTPSSLVHTKLKPGRFELKQICTVKEAQLQNSASSTGKQFSIFRANTRKEMFLIFYQL